MLISTTSFSTALRSRRRSHTHTVVNCNWNHVKFIIKRMTLSRRLQHHNDLPHHAPVGRRFLFSKPTCSSSLTISRGPWLRFWRSPVTPPLPWNHHSTCNVLLQHSELIFPSAYNIASNVTCANFTVVAGATAVAVRLKCQPDIGKIYSTRVCYVQGAWAIRILAILTL